MTPSTPSRTAERADGIATLFGRRRLAYTLVMATLLGVILAVPSYAPVHINVARAWLVGLIAMIAFGIVEQWPRRIPDWAGRWVLQLLAVVVSVPLGAALGYTLTYPGDFPFWNNRYLVNGYRNLVFAGILFAPWVALGAMIRQREAFARHQALRFELERAKLERQALDARMRLLQAQVQPHFLFNTLANIQALVDIGSPRASTVLSALVAYLRAAVPHIDEPVTTLRQERELVRAYLELMHLRMPDRLRFGIQVEDEALDLRCPPLTLLTLVENAVRHGIDPSEEGGSIDIGVRVRDGRCHVRVADTGIGLQPTGKGNGTGLATLRERLQLTFGGDVGVRVASVEPHGVAAELDFPAQRSTP